MKGLRLKNYGPRNEKENNYRRFVHSDLFFAIRQYIIISRRIFFSVFVRYNNFLNHKKRHEHKTD